MINTILSANIPNNTTDYAAWIAATAAIIIIPITVWGIFRAPSGKIEEQKLRLSVKPRLWLNGVGYTGHTGELYIDLNNKGEVAHLDEFNLISGDIVLHSKSLPYDLEKDSRRNIYGRSIGIKHIMNCEYEIEILYHNALNQPYRAIIKGSAQNAKLISDKAL